MPAHSVLCLALPSLPRIPTHSLLGSRFLDFEAMSEELAFLRRLQPRLLLTTPSYFQNATFDSDDDDEDDD